MATTDTLKRQEYQLVIRVPFEALDGPQARQIARRYMEAAGIPEGAVVKLQRVFEDKAPQSVKL